MYKVYKIQIKENDYLVKAIKALSAPIIGVIKFIKNLIQNAISYGEPNFPIEISIGEIPQYIVIKVKDYGAGISQADIDKIFNKYYSAAKKFRKIGTGLGLYLALQIVKGHGGELAVESEEGKFTEFTIKLPAVMNINLHYGE